MISNMDGSHILATMNHIFHLPEALDLLISPTDHIKVSQQNQEHTGFVPAAADIKQTPKEYVFYVDVPGLSKSDIQVDVEEEKLMVVKSNGAKRKREGEDGEDCKYLRLERKTNRKFERKFTLPGDANVEAISAACHDGVLTITVPRIPPPQKSKTVQISVN